MNNASTALANRHSATMAVRPAAEESIDLDVDVQPLRTHAEMEEGVRLQRAVWGDGYRDAVPASLLKVSQKVGGLAAGAWTGNGEMVGFVYGLTGVDTSGRVIHWSHMLAVLPSHRNRGVVRQLILFQRRYLGGLGVEMMYWTFDPLVARNAHMNLNRLGVHVVDYVPDMYANTGSDLHAFGTDRLVVEWPVEASQGRRGMAGWQEAAATARILNDVVSLEGGRATGEGAGEFVDRVVRIEIPADAESMRAGSLGALREWRSSTRPAFLSLLEAGYEVAGFQRAGGRCFYVLVEAD